MPKRRLATGDVTIILADGRRRHLHIARDIDADRYELTLRTRQCGVQEGYWRDLTYEEYCAKLAEFGASEDEAGDA
jgi:hypothetical protein